MKRILQLLSVLSVGFLISVSANPVFAKKGGNGGGGGGEPCVDIDPAAFVYVAPASGQIGESIVLSSSSGCTTQILYTSDAGFYDFAYNRSGPSGTVVWTTDPGRDNSYVIEKLSITFGTEGAVTSITSVDQLSSEVPGEYYLSIDIASSGQIAVHHLSSNSEAVAVIDIIDLFGNSVTTLATKDSADQVYDLDGGQKWSSSGKDLYVQGKFTVDGDPWSGILRYSCGSGGCSIPELVAAGPTADDARPSIVSVHPDKPGQIAVAHFVRKKKGTGYYLSILDVGSESCLDLDFPKSDWNSGCTIDEEIVASRRASWHTSDEILFSVNSRHSQDIWLYTISTGQTTKLIRDGDSPDSAN